MKTQDIIELEDQFQLATYAKLPIAVERGIGCYLWDADGRKYLDFYGGHCVTPLGHCPPAVVEAIREQAGKLLFYSNVVYNATRARAAELLVSILPSFIDRVFFCNSGTEANETALKLARKATGRPRVVAFKQAFHGRTLGSLSVTWNERYRAPYLEVLGPTTFVPLNNLDAVNEAVGQGDVAAVIVEPIQSMAGMVEVDSSFLTELGNACRNSGTMLILDEVQTGVGRTGTFSISEQMDVEPDLITMAKSLGSGIPVGAVLATRAVADTVELADQGTTFGGGMIAMAAVIATLETVVGEGLMDRAAEIFDSIERGVAGLGVSVRGRGCLIGIELDRPAKPVIAALREDGVLVGGSGDPRVIRLMPPLNTPDDVVDEFLASFKRVMAVPSEASTV
ncbi:MAG: aspartate aminotransferase family protein [Rhodothermia bacterium]|nr:aspartate aminotransferase family protein [Rhodothermia bacterium]